MSDPIELTVRRVLAEVLETDVEKIAADAVKDDLSAWDSLAHLRLITALEEELAVRFSMAEIGEMASVAAIVAAARAHGAGA